MWELGLVVLGVRWLSDPCDSKNDVELIHRYRVFVCLLLDFQADFFFPRQGKKKSLKAREIDLPVVLFGVSMYF